MTMKKLPTIQLTMVSNFQCSGCVLGGPDPRECDSYKLEDLPGGSFACKKHAAGTMAFPGGTFYLGMPRGFCKVGAIHTSRIRDPNEAPNNIRLWPKGVSPLWDRANLPVWAMERDGYLFVRTYMPRINRSFVDVIEGGSRAELTPNALDVATFYDEID